MLIRVNDYVLNNECVRALIPKLDNQKPPRPCMVVHYKDDSNSDIIPYDVGKLMMDIMFPEFAQAELQRKQQEAATPKKIIEKQHKKILSDENGNKIINSENCEIGK